MLKGVLLGVCLSVFVTSLIFTVSGMINKLEENIITGAVIGSGVLVQYSLLFLIFSAAGSVAVMLWMRS